ncbi:outer membrane lipoprotein-sorting protein [Evansella halocellulosilytica]|uniref:outer membrane lipoprotein-sorting protein n=1 Tax=Evansella halocellulosilytica TaxID=2011013 RepID=UPI000BB8A856|nr:outer membrane lipoprotein-sorting protein [Evansella halocellulosilytica]
MKKLLLAAAGSGTLILAACSMDDPEVMIERAIEAQENIDSYYAEVTSTFSMNGFEEDSSYIEYNQKPSSHRQEMDDGTLYISNDSESWTYDPSTQEAMRFDNNVGEGEVPDESEMMRDMLTYMFENHDIIINGQDTVAGRDTFHLTIDYHDEDYTDVIENYEIWIDKETYLPLKMVSSSDEFDMTLEYTSIEYNVDLDPALFEFELPAGASIVDWDSDFKEFDTLEELEESAVYDFPDFTVLPENFEFVEGSHFGEQSSFFVFENDKGEEYLINILNDSANPPVPEGSQEVNVNGTEGQYYEMADIRSLSFNKNDLTIEITSFSDDLAKEELLEIAVGVE